ncbi:MAG: RNA polymerase sigma-70 factor [candidate division KSB1 bacterium]|nr:RNA polymerase sigma-70 factor [candidate division KSB1 bacterium]
MKQKWENSSDEQLAAALVDSNETAFKTVFRRYYKPLYAFVYTRIRSSEQARDFVQDAFAKLWMHRHTLKPEMGCKAYLFRIADRQLIDFYRRQSSRQEYQQEARRKSEAYQDHSDLQLALQNAITDLPEPVREVFVLGRYEGYTYAEIAVQLEVSVKTVESRMSNALKQLRKKLQEFQKK